MRLSHISDGIDIINFNQFLLHNEENNLTCCAECFQNISPITTVPVLYVIVTFKCSNIVKSRSGIRLDYCRLNATHPPIMYNSPPIEPIPLPILDVGILAIDLHLTVDISKNRVSIYLRFIISVHFTWSGDLLLGHLIMANNKDF